MDSRVEHAAALLDAGRPTEALDIVGPVLAGEPDDVEALQVAASALSRLRRHRSAADAAEHAVRLNPDDAQSWRVLADVRRRAQALNSAIDAARRVVELTPWDWAAYANLANLWSSRDPGGDAAVTAGDEAVRLGPNAPEAHIALGTALLRQGLTKPAVESLTNALRLDPYNEVARHNLAVARMRRGDHARAVTDLAGLAAEHPNHTTSLPAMRMAMGRLLGQIHLTVFLGLVVPLVAGVVAAAIGLGNGTVTAIFVLGLLAFAVAVAVVIRTRIVLGSSLTRVLRFVSARDRLLGAWAVVDALALICMVTWSVLSVPLGPAVWGAAWALVLAGLVLRLVRSGRMQAEGAR